MEERLQKHGFVDESISEAETQHDRTSSRSWETMDDVMETMDQPFSTGTPAHASLVHSEQSSGEPRGRWSTAVQLSLVEDEVPDSSGDGPSSRRQSSQPQHGHAGVIREYSAGDGVPDGLGSHPNSEQHPVDWSGTASIWRRRRWFQDDLTKSSTATTDDGGAVSRPIRGLVASAVDVPQEYGVARDAIPSGVSSPSPPIEAPPAPAMQMSETRTLHEHEDDWDETRPVRSWKRQGVIFDRVAPGSANGRIIWAQAFSIKGDREREQMLQRRWEMGWT
ncbi:MAG: hypothetical protein M1817_001548 [Caeruleum heppii]|nr:MAG: hypothetical protein M1817_001548 [Caeruleum heppii]